MLNLGHEHLLQLILEICLFPFDHFFEFEVFVFEKITLVLAYNSE